MLRIHVQRVEIRRRHHAGRVGVVRKEIHAVLAGAKERRSGDVPDLGRVRDADSRKTRASGRPAAGASLENADTALPASPCSMRSQRAAVREARAAPTAHMLFQRAAVTQRQMASQHRKSAETPKNAARAPEREPNFFRLRTRNVFARRRIFSRRTVVVNHIILPNMSQRRVVSRNMPVRTHVGAYGKADDARRRHVGPVGRRCVMRFRVWAVTL